MRLRLVRVLSFVLILSLGLVSSVTAAPATRSPADRVAAGGNEQQHIVSRDIPLIRRVVTRLLKSWGVGSQADTMSTPRP